MTPERIAEIAHDYAEFCIESSFLRIKKGIQDAIEQALEEENRWFYPEKGELPKKDKKIYFITSFLEEHIGLFSGIFNDYFWCAVQRFSFPANSVKCWRYAPKKCCVLKNSDIEEAGLLYENKNK